MLLARGGSVFLPGPSLLYPAPHPLCWERGSPGRQLLAAGMGQVVPMGVPAWRCWRPGKGKGKEG